MVNESSRRSQVNARLEPHAFDVVRAVAFVDETSEADVVRRAVDDLVAQREGDPEVREALKGLAHRRARKEGKVTEIRKADPPALA